MWFELLLPPPQLRVLVSSLGPYMARLPMPFQDWRRSGRYGVASGCGQWVWWVGLMWQWVWPSLVCIFLVLLWSPAHHTRCHQPRFHAVLPRIQGGVWYTFVDLFSSPVPSPPSLSPSVPPFLSPSLSPSLTLSLSPFCLSHHLDCSTSD